MLTRQSVQRRESSRRLKSLRELHAYIRHEKELPFQRVLDLRRIMEEGARTLNRIRFSAKAKNRSELLLFMRQQFMGRGHPCPQATDVATSAMTGSAGERLCDNEGTSVRVRREQTTPDAKRVGHPRPSLAGQRPALHIALHYMGRDARAPRISVSPAPFSASPR